MGEGNGRFGGAAITPDLEEGADGEHSELRRLFVQLNPWCRCRGEPGRGLGRWRTPETLEVGVDRHVMSSGRLLAGTCLADTVGL